MTGSLVFHFHVTLTDLGIQTTKDEIETSISLHLISGGKYTIHRDDALLIRQFRYRHIEMRFRAHLAI